MHPTAAYGDDLSARLGFGGAVRVGVPVPLTVVLPPLPYAGPGRIEVDAPVLGRTEGEAVTTTVVPFVAVAGVRRTFETPIQLGDIRRPLEVRVSIGGRERLRQAVPIDPQKVGGRVAVEISDSASGLAPLGGLPERVVTAYVGPEALPRRWQEYAAIDLLVARDLDPARLDQAQRDALVMWVRLGGRLVVIAPPGAPSLDALDDILPASIGTPAVVASEPSPPAGASLPSGPYPVDALRPHPGASARRAGGIPVIAGAHAGAGWVQMWGFDPGAPPFAGWPGRTALWQAALGPAGVSPVQVDAAAEQLPAAPAIDPLVHAEVGGAVLAYLAALYLIGRHGLTRSRVLAAAAAVLLAAAVFWRLAGDVRARSTSVVEATFLEQAPDTAAARAMTVGTVAVPYGGRYTVRVPAGSVVMPVTASGALRIVVTDEATLLDGVLENGEARAFAATAAVASSARADLSPDGRALRVSLGARARRAELHWGHRWYWIGDAGPDSTIVLDPKGWESGGGETTAHDRSWVFVGPNDDAIISPTTPLFVGEIQPGAPVFQLADGGGLDRRPTILLLPVGRR